MPSLSTPCTKGSPCTGGAADPTVPQPWGSCAEALKESHLVSTQAKVYLESLRWEASEVDTKDKSSGEEVKSQVLCLLSGQGQGLQGARLHGALEKTSAESSVAAGMLTDPNRIIVN